MAFEPCPHQRLVPRPAVLGIGRGVDADETAAAFHERTQRRLLRRVQHVAGGAGEHHHAIARQSLARKHRGILAVLDFPTHSVAKRAQRVHRSGNRVVPEPGRLGEHRSEEHTSELQSLMRISYAVFCLKKKKYIKTSRMYTHSQYTI